MSSSQPNKDETYREKRRQLRQNYQQLIQKTISSKSELCKPGTKALQNTFQQGNKLFEEVTHAREGSLDAQWFNQASAYTLEQSNKIHVGKVWDPEEFVTKLKAKYWKSNLQEEDSRGDMDWQALGNDVLKYFKRTPTVTFMYGPLKIEQKVIERKKRKKKVNDAEVVNPEQIKKQEKQKNETERGVKRIYKTLVKKGRKAPFKTLVIDKKSFTKSIENLFYYSFLVKDGISSLSVSPSGEMIAATAEPPTEEQFKSGAAERKQCILKFNLDMWKKMTEQENQQ